MMITKQALTRRTVLRGLGTALALPLLDAMIPAFASALQLAATRIRRLGVVYVPNGMAMPHWTPPAEGPLTSAAILRPLVPFESSLLVLSGLDGRPGGGAHAGASTRFLTGAVSKKSAYQIEAGVSIDQLLAREMGRHTELASLEVGLENRDNAGSCDQGYACAYVNTISWRTETTPLPMETNPSAVFERLFGDSGTTDPAVRFARMEQNRSILDSVTDKAASLQRKLGAADRGRLTEYLEAVRDAERRIHKAQQQTEWPVVDRPVGIPATYEEHAKLMFDLQALAFQCDLTRVITFMMARELSGRSYPEIGVSDSHHPLSHHENDPTKLATMSKINTFHTTLFAHYLEKLQSTPDGDGSLLDHTLLLYGAGMGNSNAHSPDDLPVLLAGGREQFQGGRHVVCADGTQMANLLLTIMDKFDVPVESLGDSTGKLDVEPLTL